VTKIREKGKSHNRLLGIDNAKIYNLYKEFKDQQNTGLTNILSNLFYTKIAPKNPERPISDVIDAKILTGNKFSIQYKAGNGKRKSIEYEADDLQTANKIVSKLQTIKFFISFLLPLILLSTIGIWKRKESNIKQVIHSISILLKSILFIHNSYFSYFSCN